MIGWIIGGVVAWFLLGVAAAVGLGRAISEAAKR